MLYWGLFSLNIARTTQQVNHHKMELNVHAVNYTHTVYVLYKLNFYFKLGYATERPMIF